MRPLRLGLSQPKAKKLENIEKTQENVNIKVNTSDTDEINASRETITDISNLHLKRAIKVESTTAQSILENTNDLESPKQESEMENNISIIDLVKKLSKNENIRLEPAKTYDLEKDFIPAAGPSTNNQNKDILPQSTDESVTDMDSSQEDKGIKTFYASKLFDSSLDINSSRAFGDNEILESNVENVANNNEAEVKNTNTEIPILNADGENSLVSKVDIESPQRATILTPKIKPPTKSYVKSTFDKYKIPKVIHKVVPHYSNHKDVGDKVEIGQLVLKLQSKSAKDQKPFEKVLDTISIEEWRQLLFLQTNELSQESSKPEALKSLLAGNKNCILEPVKRPPTKSAVMEWIRKSSEVNTERVKDDICKNIEELDSSQVLGLQEDEIENSISLGSNEKVMYIILH